jgi:hypothetical protein
MYNADRYKNNDGDIVGIECLTSGLCHLKPK